MNRFTCTKKYTDLPAAHRQHNHDGHCALIHGHDWAFEVTFASRCLNDQGFVVDFGKLGWLKKFLVTHFDHTLLLNSDDPMLAHFQRTVGDTKMARIVVVPNCGAESLAQFVLHEANRIIECTPGIHDGWGVKVISVVCWEDSKNRAEYTLDE